MKTLRRFNRLSGSGRHRIRRIVAAGVARERRRR
jgi:hypothetical protein